MKNLIKQILREETSGLTDKQIKAGYVLMNNLTKGYHWYSTPNGLWLINPDTKEWMFELQKNGHLWYYYETPNTFSRYLNMEEYDFESFIKIWVEDVLKRGVVSTHRSNQRRAFRMEFILKRGVVSTASSINSGPGWVEDALENGKQLK